MIQTVPLVTAIRSTRLVLEAAVGYRNSLYKFMWVPNKCNYHENIEKNVVSSYLDCPLGFVTMEGDIWGKHLGAPHVSLEECANQCRAMTNCRSFSHSKSKNQCKLMDKKTPTNEKYKHYMFCSRT